MAAQRLGLTTVPVVVADNLDDKQVKALRLVDNKSNESGWDLDLLKAEIPTLDLEDFNSKNGTDLVSVLKVHFEPMGIYSSHYNDLGWHILKEKESKIAIPNDVSNKERAMNLLNDKFGDTLSHYEIIEAEAQSLPALLEDVDYAVINGNYALSSKITDKCLATEDSSSDIAQRNANIIAVKKENKDKPWVAALIKALTSDTVKSYIDSEFGASVKVVF